jgi:WD40 repeat protein
MANAATTNPYVGPRAFRRNEMMYGRDQEARDLFDLLVSERIVLLHSPSGAGKSSLIQAALIPLLIAEDESFQVLPLIRVNEPPRVTVANRYIYSMLHSLEDMTPAEQRLPIETLARLSLAEYLDQRLSAQNGAQSIVFIFDQFEEILSLDPTDGEVKIDFFTQVGRALRDQWRWALFAMREDYLGALDPYQRLVPTRMDNTFRLDLLKRDAADQAIQKPALSHGVDFQPAAVRQLCDDLRKTRIQQPDGTAVERLGDYVEPVQLQVVCSRLWEEYAASGQITLNDVKSIKNVDEALADYYAASVKTAALKAGVKERLVRDWFAQHLITRQGLRGQVLREPRESAGLSNDAIDALIEEHLVRREERSGATWYELAHDRLIVPVQRDNDRWFEEQLSSLQKRARQWSDQGEPSTLLFSGGELTQAEQWASKHDAELSNIERKFLKECQEVRAREEQRIRDAEERAEQAAQAAARLQARNRVIIGLAVAALLVALIAVASFVQANQQSRIAQQTAELAQQKSLEAQQAAALAQQKEVEANQERERAERSAQEANEAKRTAEEAERQADQLHQQAEQRNRSLQLADYVDDVLRPDLALLLSLEAQNITRTIEARASLLTTLIRNAHLTQFLQHAQAAPFYSVAFSPDNTLVASSGAAEGDSGLIQIWEVATGALTQTITTTQPIVALTFIDRDQLVTKDLLGALTLWEWQTKTPTAVVAPASLDQLNNLAVSSDGQALAASSFTTIYVWDIASGLLLAELPTPEVGVLQLAFAPGSLDLAASYSDGTLRLWNAATGQLTAETATLEGITPGALLAGEDQLVVAYSPGWLIGWNTAQNITQSVAFAGSAPLAALSLTSDRVVTAGEPSASTLTLFDQANGKRDILTAHTEPIAGVAFSSDGTWLASTSSNGEVVLWRATGSPVSSVPLVAGDRVAGLAFVTDRELAVVEPERITWQDRASSEPVGRPLSQTVTSVAANHAHDLLALGDTDGRIEVWSMTRREPIDDFVVGYLAPLSQLSFSAGGRWLAGLDASGHLSVIDLTTGQPWQPEADLSTGITAITFHPTHPDLLVVGAEDGRLRLYDAASGQDVTPPTVASRPGPITHLAFSADGEWLAVVEPRVIRTFSLEGGDERFPLQINRGTLSAVLFGPDDETLITGMTDGSIILWDLTSGRRLGTLLGHAAQVNALALSPDGHTLASGAEDATVVWRKVAEAEWVQLACRIAGRNLTPDEWELYFREEGYRLTCPEAPH